jgi:VCBS repeat protein
MDRIGTWARRATVISLVIWLGPAWIAGSTGNAVSRFVATASGFVSGASSDVNGDGKADAIAVNSDGIAVRLSTGSAFSNANPSHRWLVGSFSGSVGTYFADVTGDGKADAIAVSSDGIAVRPSTGTSFSSSNVTHRWTVSGFSGSIGTFFADVNGDGKADAIAVNSDGIAVHLSSGAYFSSANLTQRWTVGGFYGNIGTFFADVNGDGKADAIAVNTNGISVHPSTGSYFAVTTPSSRATIGGYYGTVGTFFADANGDGKADAIAVNQEDIAVETSRGLTFGSSKGGTTAPPYWTRTSFFGDVGTFFADVNGDARADAIAVNGDGIAVLLSEGWNFVKATPDNHWTAGGFVGSVGTFLDSQPKSSG